MHALLNSTILKKQYDSRCVGVLRCLFEIRTKLKSGVLPCHMEGTCKIFSSEVVSMVLKIGRNLDTVTIIFAGPISQNGLCV